MNKCINTIIMLFFSLMLFGQDTDSIKSLKLIQLDVDYYIDSIPNTYGGVSPFGNNYKGELIQGIVQLTGIPISRLKISKDAPLKYIGYKIYSSHKVRQLEEMALEELAKMCEFKIFNIIDTCTVWKFEVRDSSKLVPFSWDRDSPNGFFGVHPINNGKDMNFFGQTLTGLTFELEFGIKQHIFYTDSQDSVDEPNRYKFVIPGECIKDFKLLKSFMLDRYGIELIPVKRGIEKKYIEFNKK